MASEHEPFALPRLIGARFDGGVVPVDTLSELAAYRDLVLEVAKALWRAKNPGRRRITRGFEASFSIALRGIGAGSAVPELVRPAPRMRRIFHAGDVFEESRDLVSACVAAVASNEPLPADFPREALGLFNRFGQKLGPNEAIELRGPDGAAGPKYTREVRKRLVLLSSDDYEDNVEIAASIASIDVKSGMFEVDLEGRRIKSPIGQHEERLLDAAMRRATTHLRIRGVAALDSEDRVVRFIEASDVFIVEARGARPEIANQVADLRALSAGWLDGEGDAPSHVGLAWLEPWLSNAMELGLPAPRLFPTIDGNVHAEWSAGVWEASATFDLAKRTATLLAANVESGEDVEDELDCADSDAPWALAAWLTSFAAQEAHE